MRAFGTRGGAEAAAEGGGLEGTAGTTRLLQTEKESPRWQDQQSRKPAAAGTAGGSSDPPKHAGAFAKQQSTTVCSADPKKRYPTSPSAAYPSAP